GFILPGLGAVVNRMPKEHRAKIAHRVDAMSAQAAAQQAQTGDPQLDAAIDEPATLSVQEQQIVDQKAQQVASEAAEQQEQQSEETEEQPDPNVNPKTQAFFSDVVTGQSDTFKPVNPYQPLIERTEEETVFEQTYDKHKGRFDEHIATSIPGFRDVQVKKGNAIVKSLPKGGHVIDIAGSEGGLMKAITEQSGGAITTTNLDTNEDMKKAHESTPVKGAEFAHDSFGKYKPEQKADVVHESMAFQFMSPDRASQFQEVADNYLKPNGIFIVEEKVGNSDWDAN